MNTCNQKKKMISGGQDPAGMTKEVRAITEIERPMEREAGEFSVHRSIVPPTSNCFCFLRVSRSFL